MGGADVGVLKAGGGSVILGLFCLVLVLSAFMWRFWAGAKRRQAAKGDPHAFTEPGLGMIMADGGQPIRRATSVDAWSPWEDERELEVGE